jgi:hypothetical protein
VADYTTPFAATCCSFLKRSLNPRRSHYLPKERAMTTDTEYDKALKDSFPASDAPANSGITGAGETDKKPSQKSDTARTETVDESGAVTPG